MGYTRKYYSQKHNAKYRGIEFKLTYEEWLNWWIETGKLEQRGRGLNQYQMCRYNDEGPYELGNMYCKTTGEHTKERDPWNKNHTKKEFPQLSNSGVKNGNTPWNKTITLEFIREQFELEGYQLIGKEYIDAHMKLDYICPRGHRHSIIWNNWKTGSRCKYCRAEKMKGRGNPSWIDGRSKNLEHGKQLSKQWREDNKEHIKKYLKQYRQNKKMRDKNETTQNTK